MTDSDSQTISNWLSTASSIAAALIGIVTLLTVYIAAVQLASQNRIYKLGLSWRSLGPWRSKVGKLGLFGLQRRVYAPTLSLDSLVGRQWRPALTFPLGFPKKSDSSNCLEDGQNVQAKASWVNFMQALGLKPDDETFYEMEDASELINGIVPMNWKGKDLVGMCSILGFHSHESKPSFKSPMPLPMQWSGPLGWIQFRSSSNGCVAEFWRRMDMYKQISPGMHKYWANRDISQECYFFHSRLWNSINGFCLPHKSDGWYKTLYLGGADEEERAQEAEDEDDVAVAESRLFEDLATMDLPEEEIMRKLFGKKEQRTKALNREVERKGQAKSQRGRDMDIPDFLDSVLRDKIDETCGNKLEILRPCPGLLSVSVQGQLAYNRGLRIEGCQEYDRKYIDPEDLDRHKYPYNLGNLYMDDILLALMKDALLGLKPDGFYFSPTWHLYTDIVQVYKHIEEQSNKLKEIFQLPTSQKLLPLDGLLYNAMTLCNELQKTRKTARAMFSVEDMRLLAKASCSLKGVISPVRGDHGEDLVWAMLCCPELSSDIRKALKNCGNASEFVTATARSQGGILDCSSFVFSGNFQNEKAGRYEIPLLRDGEFSGSQILAALSDVFITYFWIEKKWITNVAAYDTTMPQSVTMC